MTTETRLSALDFATKLNNRLASPDDLIDAAGKIEAWIDGENPAEERFQDLRSDLRRLENRIDQRDIYDRVERGSSSDATGWFVGVIVALALLAIGYLVWSANNDVSERPAVTQVQP